MTDSMKTTGFDVLVASSRELDATWRGLVGAPAGPAHLCRSEGAHTGSGEQARTGVIGAPVVRTVEGTRVSETDALLRERGERSSELVEATPRYGAPGQCPRRNSGPAE